MISDRWKIRAELERYIHHLNEQHPGVYNICSCQVLLHFSFPQRLSIFGYIICVFLLIIIVVVIQQALIFLDLQSHEVSGHISNGRQCCKALGKTIERHDSMSHTEASINAIEKVQWQES